MLLNQEQIAMSLCELVQGDYTLLNDIIIDYVDKLNDKEFQDYEDYVNMNMNEIM